MIRIGCASAFWGDTETAAQQLVSKGKLNYLVFDYLAEITMSIMAGQRLKKPDLGYATDFVSNIMPPLLADIASQNLKVICNAGGINPAACAEALQAVCDKADSPLKIAYVDGDNVLRQMSKLKEAGYREMFTGQNPPPAFVSANAYLGAEPIVAALKEGADIIITGRVADSALVLAPLIHEFRWSMQDYDRLAQGSLAGHIIECGAHCTGGNFTDWKDASDGFHDMGFPFVDVNEDGSFIVSKPENTGGLVSFGTVAEQLLYEIGDPENYILPDCIADFSQVTIEEMGKDQVKLSGAKGKAPTHEYKVSATWADGFKCTVTFLMAGIDAVDKAQQVSQAIITKTSRMLEQKGLAPYSQTDIELLGTEATYGSQKRREDTREVVVKISVASPDKKSLVLFSKEIAQAATGMAPGITGIVGGRPTVWPKIRLYSCLIPKDWVSASIALNGNKQEVRTSAGSETALNTLPSSPYEAVHSVLGEREAKPVKLIDLAWARSGDKGNHANIGIIARESEYLPFIKASLTKETVSDYFSHLLDPSTGNVTLYDLPRMHAINILLENSLGGGGVASLRIDPQGKAFAQQILDIEILVPKNIADNLGGIKG